MFLFPLPCPPRGGVGAFYVLISKRIFSVFQHAFFKQSYPTNKLVDYTNKLKKIHQVYSIYTLEDLFSFKRFFSLIQLYNNEYNKSYFNVYKNEKLRRKFLKLRKQTMLRIVHAAIIKNSNFNNNEKNILKSNKRIK